MVSMIKGPFIPFCLVVFLAFSAAMTGFKPSLALDAAGLYLPLFLLAALVSLVVNHGLIERGLGVILLPVSLITLSIPVLWRLILLVNARLQAITVTSFLALMLLIFVVFLMAMAFSLASLAKRGEPWLRRFPHLSALINVALLLYYALWVRDTFQEILFDQLLLVYLALFGLLATGSYYFLLLEPLRARWARLSRLWIINLAIIPLCLALFLSPLVRIHGPEELRDRINSLYGAPAYDLYGELIRKEASRTEAADGGGELVEDPFPWRWSCEGTSPEKLNIVVFLIDAVRADHTPFLDYPRDTMPFIDAFARRNASIFQRAFSAEAGTFGSLPALFSGKAPSHLIWREHPRFNELAEENVMLPELLAKNGYVTGAVINSWIQNAMAGFAQGFAEFSPIYTKQNFAQLRMKASPLVNRTALDFLERHKAQPFFLFLYYEDPHSPYTPHPEMGKSFGKEAIDRYDGEIAYADRRVGFILDYLQSQEYWDRTIVIICADHGEEFKEHGKTNHAKQLYRESIHVPLVVRVPGLKPRVIASNVSLLDIVPTLLELTCIPPEDPRLHGISLLPLMRGEKVKKRFVFSEIIKVRRKSKNVHRSVVYEDHHLVHNEVIDQFQLYNMKEDPREERDIKDQRRDIYNRLRSALEILRSSPPPEARTRQEVERHGG